MMKIDTKESSKRYFYVQYSFTGGVGAISIEVIGMLNNQNFKHLMKDSFPNLHNLFILGWVEMDKEDSKAFNYEVRK